VRLGINKKTGEHFAIKIINKRKFWHLSKSREQILREIEILKKVKHPNIISYVDIFDSEHYIYLVLELYVLSVSFSLSLSLSCFH
jgi:serine/threonine protein kinase